MSTTYHSQYWAHALTLRGSGGDIESLSRSIANARVDLNPHQIDAALFALRSPLSNGAIFADEVGLGKTIEAGIVLAQKWAERRRRILVIVPAMLRKQWQQELEEKFYLSSMVLDTKVANRLQKNGSANPFEHVGRFVILAEPLADGEIGRAFAHGVCPVKINVEDESHTFADIEDAQTHYLKSGTSGAAQILWAESGTGEVWAIVRLGVPSVGTHENPKVLGGSGETADIEEWDVDNQETGYDGVQFKALRLYWSGNSGDPVYQFVRTPTYDSIGRLVAVSAEVRSVAFDTGPCEV